VFVAEPDPDVKLICGDPGTPSILLGKEGRGERQVRSSGVLHQTEGREEGARKKRKWTKKGRSQKYRFSMYSSGRTTTSTHSVKV